MPRAILILISIISLGLVSPLLFAAWQMDGSGLRPISIPAHLRPVPMEAEGELDGDGAAESLVLTNGRMMIQSGDTTRWSSPDPWEVQQALISDINHDQQPEAMLLVSRPFQPWPVDAWLPNGGRIASFHDARGYSSHIILIGWDGSRFREKWAGSALARPVISMAVAWLDNKAGAYLLTLEREYDDPPYLPARQLKIWDWNGFGFSIVTSLDGPFTRLSVGQVRDQQILILE